MNNFIILADPGSNKLKIVLDGFFVKSEIELAFYLLRIEKKKLRPGFEALVDMDNLKYVSDVISINKGKMKKILKLAGAGKILFMRGLYEGIEPLSFFGGFYPN